ncbi:MAG TPA: TonB-dependent receptor, partial [Myxococcaceae bacterium]|nr:TonB-dependent receptor [Myxococcaceae bacterium]
SPRGTGHTINPSTGQPDFNNPETISILRNPDQFIVDAQARYDLGRALKMEQKLELTLMVVNVLNNTQGLAMTDRWETSSSRTNYSGLSRYNNRPLQAELLIRFRN